MADSAATPTKGCEGEGSRKAKKNIQGPCRHLKTAKVINATNARIIVGFDERHQATPMTKQRSSLAHDIGHVVRTNCPMRWDS
ncbi:hypothetical protein D8674_031131 [Pyrus ussuriensis x Pyrus communis]|uniref:Uncharacterized protein n=1 Tax=Pyrus ussuriensis x Pyrus communis TaxID=2448454 RepID=A0A5N5F0H4_9ROSA|nr:hypothetical protein D8674_031131 [Pyrus ussuriensis x Pyrus communis]